MTRSTTDPDLFEHDINIERTLYRLRKTRRKLFDPNLFVENYVSSSDFVHNPTNSFKSVHTTNDMAIHDNILEGLASPNVTFATLHLES